MNFYIQFTILSILFMYTNSVISRNDYLSLRNYIIKKYFSLQNSNIKKTYYFLSNKIDYLYNKYQNICFNLSYKYYNLTEEELLLLDGITFMI